ncbi:MAG: multiprotein-bridging factor 1 family protein [Nanoarchaeota archaeon]
MSSCELCGKEGILLQTKIENTILALCSDCRKHGNIIDRPKEKPKILIKVADDEELLLSDYAVQLKKAREQRNLTQQDLAIAISEKKSMITKIESGSVPNDSILKKLEQFFRIKLTEKTKKDDIEGVSFKDSSVTIGDLLKKKNEN